MNTPQNKLINSFDELDELITKTYDHIIKTHFNSPQSKKQNHNQNNKQAFIIYLLGDLGTGKTTFSQRFIKYCGFNGKVTSPTYALMNDYDCFFDKFDDKSTSKTSGKSAGKVIHCDLYRLADPEEIYEIGLLEYLSDCNNIALIEWAGNGKGVLPKANLTLDFCLNINERIVKISN